MNKCWLEGDLQISCSYEMFFPFYRTEGRDGGCVNIITHRLHNYILVSHCIMFLHKIMKVNYPHHWCGDILHIFWNHHSFYQIAVLLYIGHVKYCLPSGQIFIDKRRTERYGISYFLCFPFIIVFKRIVSSTVCYKWLAMWISILAS